MFYDRISFTILFKYWRNIVFGQFFWLPVYEHKAVLLLGGRISFCLAVLGQFSAPGSFKHCLPRDSEQFWELLWSGTQKLPTTAYQTAQADLTASVLALEAAQDRIQQIDVELERNEDLTDTERTTLETEKATLEASIPDLLTTYSDAQAAFGVHGFPYNMVCQQLRPGLASPSTE